MAGLPKGKCFTTEKKRSLLKLGPVLIIALIGLVLVLIVPKSTPDLASRNSTIRVFTFDGWAVNQTDADLQYIATHYDVLITDGCSYYNSKVGYLHQQNPALKVLPYKNALVVVKNEDDWVYINANHPDWFLKDASGNRVYEKYFPNNFLLNPNNAGWQAYRAQQLQEYTVTRGYDGVYLDVILPWINDGYGYIYYNAQPINPATGARFTNTEWKQANLGFLDSMKQAIGPIKTLMINGLSNGDTYYKWGVSEYMTYADSALMEGFLRWGNQAVSFNKSETEWKKDIDAVNAVAQMGKEAVVMTAVYDEVAATATETRTIHLYSLSSYLLVSGSTTGYCFMPPSTTSVQPYDDLWSTPIGAPLAPYYKANNVYQRDFTDGKVLVNPTDGGQTFNVALGGSYRTLDGQVVTSISLAPKTGTILTKIAGAGVPTVSFNSLVDGAVVSGKATLSANANDDLGVTKVEFYVDGELDSTDTAAPYEATWYTNFYTNGNHTITAKAYDASGNTGTATITVNVSSQIISPLTNTSVLVKYKAGTTQAAIDAVVQRLNLVVQKASDLTYRVSVPGSVSAAHFISVLLNQPEIDYAEPDYTRSKSLEDDITKLTGPLSISNEETPSLEAASALEDILTSGVTTGAENLTSQSLSLTSVTNQEPLKAASRDIGIVAVSGLYTVLALFAVAIAAFIKQILFF